jgi:DNA-binding CsgD family transcriptional regulator
MQASDVMQNAGRGRAALAVAVCDCHRQAAGEGWRGVAHLPPALAGRDEQLALAARRLTKAASGAGQLLFITGEAGIGKTSLLGAIERHAAARGFAVVRARAFPGDLRSPAGILLALADDLARAGQPPLRGLGAGLLTRLRARPAGADEMQRWRRALAQDLTDMLAAIRPAMPVLMVLDDLHWADELSLDVLSHMACQIAARPVLVAASYRGDELYPKLRLRDLSARLVARRLAEEIALPRLCLDQTAAMIGAMLGRPAQARLVTSIHERSSGIPLHVEQLLAAMGRDGGGAARPGAVAAAGHGERLVALREVPADAAADAGADAGAEPGGLPTAAGVAGVAGVTVAAGVAVRAGAGAAGGQQSQPLTARELEVAQLVAAGLTNRQIAERLVLAPKTVSAHVEHMLEKLHAGRRAEIAAWYVTVRPGSAPRS